MNYSRNQLISLVALRFVVGWHLFYEGILKVLNPTWTAKAYLLDSGGFAKNFFIWIANHPTLLAVNDFVNAWVLTISGFFLLAGIFVRPAAITGMVLLGMYYLSHPAFPGIEYMFPTDGKYFLINKTIIELVCLGVICAFPTSHIIGIGRLFKKIQ